MTMDFKNKFVQIIRSTKHSGRLGKVKGLIMRNPTNNPHRPCVYEIKLPTGKIIRFTGTRSFAIAPNQKRSKTQFLEAKKKNANYQLGSWVGLDFL